MIIPGSTQPSVPSWWWDMKSFNIFSPGLTVSQRYLITGDHHHAKIVLQFIMTATALSPATITRYYLRNDKFLRVEMTICLYSIWTSQTDRDPPPDPDLDSNISSLVLVNIENPLGLVSVTTADCWLVTSFLPWGWVFVLSLAPPGSPAVVLVSGSPCQIDMFLEILMVPA